MGLKFVLILALVLIPTAAAGSNRVWDGSKGMSLTYTWDPMSFSGFYYDLDDNIGTEELTISLESSSDRNVGEGNLVYESTLQEVYFSFKPWGKYKVVGFMADKYFAGYTSATKIPDVEAISTLSSNQLHRILLDDKDQRVVYASSTLALRDGYVLKIKDVNVDIGEGQILVTLLKDGEEISEGEGVVSSNGNYVYAKSAGKVKDLPIILIHVDKVFRGREVNAAFIKGIFQISENYLTVSTKSRYGEMEVTSVGDRGIIMKNRNSITLSQGSLIDIMGNIKIRVADSDVLRFAPQVQKIGAYEVRGTVATDSDTWTPMNFEGLYYDIDRDIGTEELDINLNGRTIDEKDLVYSTKPQEVSFDYSSWGKYLVLGFLGEKYFAGYTSASKIPDVEAGSTIGYHQLHRVLLDDKDKRVVYASSILTLKDGYALKIKDVDIGAGEGQVLFTLLKDGNEIQGSEDVVAGGDDFVFSKQAGKVKDLPIILVHVDKVFRGRETNAAFIKGVFQISENYLTVSPNTRYGPMEVESIGEGGIILKNRYGISLDRGNIIDVMGNIRIRVADSSDLRYYPFIMVNGTSISSLQLAIDVPPKPSVKETITIKITAGGSPIEGAEVAFDDTIIGATNGNGALNYTLPMEGTHNITAVKLGYEKAFKTIEVGEFAENRLTLEAPSKANQFESITIRVKANKVPVEDAAIALDGKNIGRTDSRGMLNYTLEVSGTHTLQASKTDYISAAKDIDIRLPYSEFVAQDIRISPEKVTAGDEAAIKANITNIGTKMDSFNLELIVNSTSVGTKNITLAPGQVREVSFAYREYKPGNYTVEILGQRGKLEVEEGFSSLILVGILTLLGVLLGILAIYLFTGKKKGRGKKKAL